MSKRYLFLLLPLLWEACGDSEAANVKRSDPSTLTPDGMAVFRKNCVACHGSDGALGLNGAKDLSKSALPLPDRISTITHGKNLMTPFGQILSPEEINAVAAYTLTLKKQ